MTDPNLTHLYFLLDRSGSMQSIRDDTIGGFNAFIADQRQHPGDCRVTLAQFDDRYEVVYTDRPIADVPALDLHPRGTTALLDAIGRLVTDAGASLASLPEDKRPGTVIVGIMIAGQTSPMSLAILMLVPLSAFEATAALPAAAAQLVR